MPGAARDRWRRANLGLVFQDMHLLPALSALDNVLLPALFDHLRTPPALRTRALALLDGLGVSAPARRAAVLSRVERVVFGAYDAKAGAVGSLWDVVRDRRLKHRPEVVAGVLADESTELLDGFFRAHRAL